MVLDFPTRIHPPPPALVVVKQRDHQTWQGIHIHHPPSIFNIYPRTTPTIILYRRRTDANSRRWDSNAETFRTRNYAFDFDDDDNDFEVVDDANEWLNILEDFIDGVWIFKAFRSFGWMLPAIISSLLLTSGPKAFLMALAIPIGQSALSMLFQTVWGRPKSKTKNRSKSKRRARPPPPHANVYVDVDDVQEEYSKEDRKRATGYQTWVAGDGSSDKKSNNSSSSFGGWEELDGRATGSRNGKQRTSKSKISKRDRRSETPLLMRLLIAVFPFLGSWTKML
uniref:uncharacterized protein LOC122603426 n=1 Tax=Erigeron canadensis TaxID=72917 RepID=UPI001CB8F6C1|nr:uncharacterized protein LOC122603426 [Erigeron canadensis]